MMRVSAFKGRAAHLFLARSLQASPTKPIRSIFIPTRCSSNLNNPDESPEDIPSSSGNFRGFGSPPTNESDKNKKTTAEALRQSLGGVSNAEGRVSRGTNIVLGTDESEEKWRELDNQVNEYPGTRTFKAIGSGGDDFIAAMVACVEEEVGPVHEECISSRLSGKGNYISVTISVWMETPDQVLRIYTKMKEDGRLKFYI